MKERVPIEMGELVNLLDGYALNTCEVCRAYNSINPFQFKGCFFKFDINRRGPQCHEKDRGCHYNISYLRYRLTKLWKKGIIRSIKLKWFDGREGPFPQLDTFRFWYLTRQGLGSRLRDDIDLKIMPQGVPA